MSDVDVDRFRHRVTTRTTEIEHSRNHSTVTIQESDDEGNVCVRQPYDQEPYSRRVAAIPGRGYTALTRHETELQSRIDASIHPALQNDALFSVANPPGISQYEHGPAQSLYEDNLYLAKETTSASMFHEIVGVSKALHHTVGHTKRVAPTDATVLICGESGTGKELIARAIHRESSRSRRAFIRVNCAAIPSSLIASELFGCERGAFTGATQRRLGRFELANGGTIFLDEIGDIPPETQIALLRVLQEREFERVGGTYPVPIDVRVIAATNGDLPAAVEKGTFRLDLFYRLNVFPIQVPPLRERREDILPLVEHFIDRYAKATGKTFRKIEKRTLKWLQAYDWPGNIRELQNIVERAVVLCDDDVFSIDPAWLHAGARRPSQPPVAFAVAILDREREIIEAALEESRGRIAGPFGAAEKLGMPRTTLESKIKSLRINKDGFKASLGKLHSSYGTMSSLHRIPVLKAGRHTIRQRSLSRTTVGTGASEENTPRFVSNSLWPLWVKVPST